ncbi:MAG TPA: VOC family protein [Thermoleophilaceae bacterium]|nr:VOC family protein [Thermoleophilaceae bacterium]
MTTTSSAATLPATLRLGPVHLTVTDLDRSVRFYETSIGLRTHHRDGGEAVLGAGGEDLLVLVEQPGARPAGRHAGLYHYALLYPSRLELARAAKRLIAARTPISGASDHNISEAIYLPDPDGNGIELAADRPREQWGDLSDPTAIGGPTPLDMHDLLAPVAEEEPRAEAPPELRVGHLHLHVGDIERALEFWRDGIGFQVMTSFPSAAFIAAGGYHHHLGLNTWRGEGVPPQPDGVVGLRHWTIFLEDAADVAAVRERVEATGAQVEERPGGFLARDPSRNAVELSVAS